jgi:hypothetical protein
MFVIIPTVWWFCRIYITVFKLGNKIKDKNYHTVGIITNIYYKMAETTLGIITNYPNDTGGKERKIHKLYI